MKLCIRCNPVSELLTDENGELYCRWHGKNFLLEEREDVDWGYVSPFPDDVPSIDSSIEPTHELQLYGNAEPLPEIQVVHEESPQEGGEV